MYFFLVLTMFLASARGDRYADYNKFPNRHNEPGVNNYDHNRRNELGPTGYDSTHSPSSIYTNGYGNYDGYGGGDYHSKNQYCKNRSPQMDIEMEHIMGIWYGVEYIPHVDGGGPGTFWGDTCIVVHITETNNAPSTESSRYHHRTVFETMHSRQWRQLRLVWDEAGNDVEYSLFFKNDSVGFWSSHGDQRGTLPENWNYKQFTGTVQVLKAVGKHLLLHFCQAPTVGVNGQPPQLFSVLLSRAPRTLDKWQISAAHDLLRRKGLSVATRRMVCGNSANKVFASTASLVLAVLCAIFGYKAT